MKSYYLGNDVNLKFEILANGQPASGLSATAVLYDDGASGYISKHIARVSGSNVSIKLSHKEMPEVGDYVVVFNVQLKKYGQQKHAMKFKVVNLPVSAKIRKKEAVHA